MVTLACAPILILGLWGEKVPVGKGFGWDGQVYGRMAMHFEEAVFVEPITSYRVQRLLPSALVHAGLRATAAKPDETSVIRGFIILNTLLIAVSVLLWLRVASSLGLGLRGEWLGFIGLFVNWAVWKQSTYYPVLTDIAAFTLGLAAFSAYLDRRRGSLVVAGLAGAFTWPVALHGAALMLALPRPQATTRSRLPRWMILVVAGAVATGFLAAVLYLYVYRGRATPNIQSTEMASVVRDLAPLSIAAAASFLFVILAGLLGAMRVGGVGEAIRSVSPVGLVLASIPFAIVALAVRALADSAEPVTARSLLAFIALGSITKPFSFFVPHVVYFGPIVLVIALYWRRLCDVAGALGPGVVALVLMTILIAMTSESRLAIFGFPMIVALACRAADPESWTRTQILLVGALSLLYSKVWFPINTQPMEGALLDFPFQRYFMQHGPWMANATYAVHAAIVVLTAALFFVVLPRPARRDVGFATSETARDGSIAVPAS
jgi:hypothetical protein